jgi:hypothetical protein
MTHNLFSQFVAAAIAAARTTVDQKWAMLAFQRLTAYFVCLTAETEVKVKEFSENVAELVQNTFFSIGGEEHKLLQALLIERPHLLYHEELKAYLRATSDEEVARLYVERFLSLEPEFEAELVGNADQVWRCKNALAAITVMAPEQVPAFAVTALGMFPTMPIGADGNPGFRGLLEVLAKKQVEQPQVILRKEEPVGVRNGDNKPKRNGKGNGPNVGEEKYFKPASPTAATVSEGQQAIEIERAKRNTVSKAPAPAFQALAGLKASLPVQQPAVN